MKVIVDMLCHGYQNTGWLRPKSHVVTPNRLVIAAAMRSTVKMLALQRFLQGEWGQQRFRR